METIVEHQQWLQKQLHSLECAYNNPLGYDPTEFVTPDDCWKILNDAGWAANNLGWSDLASECFAFDECGDYRAVSVMLSKCISTCQSALQLSAGEASPEQTRTETISRPETPKLAIDRWSQVGIGVYADCRSNSGSIRFIAYTPCPEIGATVTISRGNSFELSSSQLSKLLLLLADSEDGKTAKKSDVIEEYRYAICGTETTLGTYETNDATSQVTPDNRLTGAIRTNARDFRNKVPMEASDNHVFSADHPTHIISQVTVRPLIEHEPQVGDSFYTFGGSIDMHVE